MQNHHEARDDVLPNPRKDNYIMRQSMLPLCLESFDG